jgi:hypothetical protein
MEGEERSRNPIGSQTTGYSAWIATAILDEQKSHGCITERETLARPPWMFYPFTKCFPQDTCYSFILLFHFISFHFICSVGV